MITIACVRASYDTDRAWCGAELSKPYFVDAEMAALAGRFDSDTHICHKCSKEIIKCLGVQIA